MRRGLRRRKKKVAEDNEAPQETSNTSKKPATATAKPKTADGNENGARANKTLHTFKEQPTAKRTPFSIRSAINKKEESNSEKKETTTVLEAPTEHKENTPLNQQNLVEIWQELAESYRKKEEISFSATLKLNDPTVVSESKIEYHIANSVQEQDFKERYQDCLNFLRKKLNNYELTIDVKKAEGKDLQKAGAYTDKEKVKLMMEKNESLKNLIEKFGLEPEF